MKRTLRLLLFVAGFLLTNSELYAQEWRELVVNGDFEGTDYSAFSINVANEGSREVTANDIDAYGTDASNHCAKITFTVSPEKTQFVVKLTEPLSEGDLYEFSFRVKPSTTGRPGNLITEEFGTFSMKNPNRWTQGACHGTISAEQNGCQSITFYFTNRLKQSDIVYFDDISLKVRDSKIPIVFADAKVKEICLSKWDTNWDDELSLGEAAAVQELGYMTFANNQEITSFDELQYFTGLTEIKGDFFGCGNLTSIIIPERVIELKKCNEWMGAFESCSNLTSVTFENGSVSIGDESFAYCTSLSSINLNNVIGIGAYAFSGCESLQSLTFPKGVQYVDENAFYDCPSLSSIVVAEGNVYYDSRENCNALIETKTNKLIRGSINTTIPNSVTAIGPSAFSGISSLTSITIPSSITSIGKYAFAGCAGPNLISINVEEGNTNYDSRNNCNAIVETATKSLILGCKNTNMIILDDLKVIGPHAFSNCSDITSIRIPNNIKNIETYAFGNCTALSSVVIGNDIRIIEGWTFMNCINLQNVYCYAEQVPNIKYNVDGSFIFYGSNYKNAILHVPAASFEAYSNVYPWNSFKSIVALTDDDPKPTGITNINDDIAKGERYYSLDGKRLAQPQRGINIIRKSDGTTKKVVIK